MNKYADKISLKILANRNLRGTPTDRLVYDLQDTIQKLSCPNDAIGYGRPSDCPEEEWIDDHKYFWEQELLSLGKEITRRHEIKYIGTVNTHQAIIQTIKNNLKVEDVLGWYTDVIVKGGSWKFRCTLHGDDKNPSGVLNRDDNTWHCFGCNKHGDVFDAVQAFERIDLPHAVAKLANHLGLDTHIPQDKAVNLPKDVSQLKEDVDDLKNFRTYTLKVLSERTKRRKDIKYNEYNI